MRLRGIRVSERHASDIRANAVPTARLDAFQTIAVGPDPTSPTELAVLTTEVGDAVCPWRGDEDLRIQREL